MFGYLNFIYRILIVPLDIRRPVAKPVTAQEETEKKNQKLLILVLFNIFQNGDLSLRVTKGRTHSDLAGYR